MANEINSLQYLIQIALDKQGAKVAQDELKKMGDEALASARKIDSSYKQVDQSISSNTKFTKDGAVTVQKMTQTLQDATGKQLTFSHSVLQSKDSVQRLDESTKVLSNTVNRNKDGIGGLIEGYGKLAIRALAVVPIWGAMRGALASLTGTFNDTTQSMIKIDLALAKLKNEFAVGEPIGNSLDLAREKAEDLAVSLGVSAEQAIRVASQFKTSNLTAAEAIAGMETAMRGSVATGEDAVQIAETLADIYKFMGSNIEGASTSQEKMNAIMGAMLTLLPTSAVSFKDFKDALANFLGTANNTNLTLNQTLALVATTGSGMQRGARGGTQLASAFNQLAQKAKDVRDFIGDTRGKNAFEQMFAILEKAREIRDKGGDIQQPIAEIFGLKGGKAVSADIALLDNLKVQLESLNRLSLKDFQAEFDKRVGNITTTVDKQLERLKQIRERLGRNFFEGFFGAGATDAANGLKGINDELVKMIPLVKTLGEALGIIAKAGGIALLVAGSAGLIRAGAGLAGAGIAGVGARAAGTAAAASLPIGLAEGAAFGVSAKTIEALTKLNAAQATLAATSLRNISSFQALGNAGLTAATALGVTSGLGQAIFKFGAIVATVGAAVLAAGASLKFFSDKIQDLRDVTEANEKLSGGKTEINLLNSLRHPGVLLKTLFSNPDVSNATTTEEVQRQELILNEIRRKQIGLGPVRPDIANNLPGTQAALDKANLNLANTTLKPSEELNLQLRAIERMQTLGFNQVEIEKMKLDLLVKQGATHEEIVAQAEKFIDSLHKEVEQFSGLLRDTTERGLSDLLQGNLNLNQFATNIGNALRKGFADSLSGNFTDQIFKATGIGEMFGGIFSNIRHANDGVKGIIVGAHETGAGIVKKALLEAFTQGAGIVNGTASAGFSGIPGLPGTSGLGFGQNGLTLPGFGEGGFFNRRIGGPAAMTGRNGQLLNASGNPLGASFGQAAGVGIGAGLLGFSAFQSAGGRQGSLAVPAGVLGSLGGAALGLSSLGFGAGAGAGALAAGLAPLLGPIGIALGIGSMLFGAFSKTKQTSIDEKTSNQQIASRVDVTNKKLELINRNLVAIRSRFETFQLPDSAFFSEKVNLEDEFSIDSRR